MNIVIVIGKFYYANVFSIVYLTLVGRPERTKFFFFLFLIQYIAVVFNGIMYVIVCAQMKILFYGQQKHNHKR